MSYFEKKPDLDKELEAAITFSDNLEDFVSLAYEANNIDKLQWFIDKRKEELEELKEIEGNNSLSLEDSKKLITVISKTESDIEYLNAKIEVLEKMRHEMEQAHKN